MANEVLIVNCDSTYPLDSVVSLFKGVDKGIDIQQKTLPISQLESVSEEVRQRRLLCGVFVVNGYESRLSINEEKAGIGYAVLYKALLEAAKGNVVVVIGGDDRYKDGEEDRSVLSTWAYHKIAAQFDDTYLDGRRGFVLSWDERHNPVHEEALGGYLRAISVGKPGLEQPFKPTPRSRPLPKPEPISRPSTSKDLIKNKTSQTDPKPHHAKVYEDSSRAAETVSIRDKSSRAAKDGRAKPHLSVADVRYTDGEGKRINETLKKQQGDILKTNPRRKIKFVGHLVYGKRVPALERGIPVGDIPDFVIEAIKSQSVQMESASVFVFDDETAQNCVMVRELTVPRNEDRGNVFVRGYRAVAAWFRDDGTQKYS